MTAKLESGGLSGMARSWDEVTTVEAEAFTLATVPAGAASFVYGMFLASPPKAT